MIRLDGRLRDAILIGIDKANTHISVERQARRKLRLQPSHELPEQPLTLGGIILREPVKTYRVRLEWSFD